MKGRQFPVAVAITLEGFFWSAQFLHVKTGSGEEAVEELEDGTPILARYCGSAFPRVVSCFVLDEGVASTPHISHSACKTFRKLNIIKNVPSCISLPWLAYSLSS